MYELLEGVAGATIVLATLFFTYGIAREVRKAERKNKHDQENRSDRP